MDPSHQSLATPLNRPMVFHVDWYVDGVTAIPDVTLRIGNGRVVETILGRTSDAVDLGRVILIPGLVNAHTHLEFSLLTEPIPTTQRFTDWIRSVVRYRQSHPGSTPQAIAAGWNESLQAGTTLVGEIATVGWSLADYLQAELGGVLFQELLGLSDERVANQRELALAMTTNPWTASSCEGPSSSHLIAGLSPHAPYSVHPSLLVTAVQLASNHSLPIAMHLAETSAEIELLNQGAGEFRELLTGFGIWREGLFGGQRPLDYLKQLAGAGRVLVIHGNYLDDEELAFLAANRQFTLVYCPRTHAAFGHPTHPWRRLLELGGNVAIGTDSRASNPNLSLFAELQFLAGNHPEISPLELLKLGSTSGRRALLGEHAQTPTADFSADFSLVKWGANVDSDPTRNLFASANQIVGTMIRGQWRFLSAEIRENLV